jgi:esterase/lipase superfamily enzyme
MPYRPSPGALFMIAVALLAGCGNPYRYQSYPPRDAPPLARTLDGRGEVDLMYATDRRATGAPETALYFGAERARDLRHGFCSVSIPSAHGRGRLESPWIGGWNAHRHVSVTAIEPPSERTAFVASLRTRVATSPRREVFVFVHGFATLFFDAARRAAQIAHDADFEGAAMVYSWPSQGWLLSYLVDTGNVEWTEPHLVELLGMLANESGAKHIHLMAHSMGARVLARAMRNFMAGRDHDDPPPFDQIILAAADIDVELFNRDYAEPLIRGSRRLTVYSSSADWALRGSRWLHAYTRLGQAQPEDIDAAWLTRIDLIDATDCDKGAIGHVYYGASPTILADLAGVIRGLSASSRGLSAHAGGYRVFEHHPDPVESLARDTRTGVGGGARVPVGAPAARR